MHVGVADRVRSTIVLYPPDDMRVRESYRYSTSLLINESYQEFLQCLLVGRQQI